MNHRIFSSASTSHLLVYACILLSIGLVSSAAAQTTVSHTFMSGQTAQAAQVNENFQGLVDAINALTARVNQLEAENASLQNQLSLVNNNPVLDLGAYVSLSSMTEPNTGAIYPVALFNGLNVQIVNGAGSTNAPPNGLGNLIVGYNETVIDLTEFCSDPDSATQIDCEQNGGFWGANQHTGSHNIVLGNGNSYSNTGGLVAGSGNAISGQGASVLGGGSNLGRGDFTTIAGGASNKSEGTFASVAGGFANTASNHFAIVLRGVLNHADGQFSTVSGGRNNQAAGLHATVSGGEGNLANGNSSSVSGGHNRSIYTLYSWGAGSLIQSD